MSSDALKSAYQLLAADKPDDAVAILQAAGDYGDSPALAELATWYLRGDRVPRDLVRARTTLRQAVTIGHVDAALLEIALTANGTGGVPDWSKATKLLSIAARMDPTAARHLALLSEMRLDRNGRPTSISRAEILSKDPVVIRFRKAFTPSECIHLAAVANDQLAPGVVIDPKTGKNIEHPVRSSYGAAIGPAQEDLVVAAINRRLAAMTRTDLGNGEPLQILRYTPGQQYRVHSDALSGVSNQRIATAIVYLNDGFEGGETDFPAIGVRVRPGGGDVLVFHNTLSDGLADPRTRHAGLPVVRGVKWIATRWIRAKPFDAWQIAQPN